MDYTATRTPTPMNKNHAVALALRSAAEAASSTVPPLPSLFPRPPPLFLWLPAVGVACVALEADVSPFWTEEAADPLFVSGTKVVVPGAKTIDVVVDEVDANVAIDKVELAAAVVATTDVVDVNLTEI